MLPRRRQRQLSSFLDPCVWGGLGSDGGMPPLECVSGGCFYVFSRKLTEERWQEMRGERQMGDMVAHSKQHKPKAFHLIIEGPLELKQQDEGVFIDEALVWQYVPFFCFIKKVTASRRFSWKVVRRCQRGMCITIAMSTQSGFYRQNDFVAFQQTNQTIHRSPTWTVSEWTDLLLKLN